jgi:hypothetical protein
MSFPNQPVTPGAPSAPQHNGHAVPQMQPVGAAQAAPVAPPQQPQAAPQPQATISPVGTHHFGRQQATTAGVPATAAQAQPQPQKPSFIEEHRQTILVGVGAGLLGMMVGGGKVTIPGRGRGPQSS